MFKLSIELASMNSASSRSSWRLPLCFFASRMRFCSLRAYGGNEDTAIDIEKCNRFEGLRKRGGAETTAAIDVDSATGSRAYGNEGMREQRLPSI